MTLDPDLFTMIINFEVPPANQLRFVEDLLGAVEGTIATLPGFRSATFLMSNDRTRIINLAQWESAEVYQESMRSEVARNAGIGRVIQRHGATVGHADSYGVARMFG